MKLWNAVLIGTLAVGVVACGDDDDDIIEPPQTQTVSLAPVAENVTGTAVITSTGNNQSSVQVTLQGLTVGETYMGAIHTGSCATPGEAVFDLADITAAAATGNATTAAVPDNVLQTGHLIQYSRQVADQFPIVACGDID